MLPDWVSNPGPLTYESGALPIALRGPAFPRLKGVISLGKILLSDEKIFSLGKIPFLFPQKLRKIASEM